MLRSSLATFSRVARRAVIASNRAVSDGPTKREIDDVFSDRSSQPDEQRRSGYSVNQVQLVGNVASDPSQLTGKNGSAFTIVNIITNNHRNVDGERKETSERHSVTVFGKQMEFVMKNIRKGSRVAVYGRLTYSGGQQKEDGTRTPKQVHIRADTILPIARSV